jgi:2-dehydro-3-deoxygalactonokinase
MIGIDWGTSSLRAYRIGRDARVTDRLDQPRGIMTVPEGGFPAALSAIIGPWIAAGETRILACGMVGSRQGWVEAPYLPCPAGAAEIARATLPLPFPGTEARLVPGLTTEDAHGVPDVMRGEETKLVALAAILGAGTHLACLPGTHAKWARIAAGRVTGFTTHMTGETFAALSTHTILARTAPEAPHDAAAFAAGVARARQPGGLLHHIFGARTLHLMDRLPAEATRGYLSGVLIGHEVAAALAESGASAVELVGAAGLAARYAEALALHGVAVRVHDPDLVAAGLHGLAGALGWH